MEIDMQLYEPYVYIKWGAIVTVIGMIPNISALGVGLLALGITLELVNRITGDTSGKTSSEDNNDG